MTRQAFVLTGLLMIGLTGSFAQNADSIRAVFNNVQDPRQRLTQIVDYGKEYFRKTPKITKPILEYGITLADSLKDNTASGTLKKHLGILVYLNGDHDQALTLYLEALKHFQSANDIQGVAETYNELGNLRRKSKNFEEAKRSFNEVIRIASEPKFYKVMGTAHNNIGITFEVQGQYDSALFNYRKAVQYHTLSKDSIDMSYGYSNIGGAMALKNLYDSALYYMNKGLEMRIRMHDQFGVSLSYVNLAELASMKKDYDAVIKYATKGVEVTTSIGFKDVAAACYNLLSVAYEAKGNVKMAYSSFKLATAYNDSIFNETKSQQLADIQTKYETENKDQEIASLKQKNTIQELTSSRQRTYYIAALLIAVVVAVLLFQFQKNKRLREKALLQSTLQKEQEKSARDVIDAEMNERRRIASELHDGVGQLFSAARMNLSGMNASLHFSNDNHQHVYQNTLKLIDEGCQELRAISHSMMPEALLKKGLVEALHELINRLDQNSLAVALDVFGIEHRLPQAFETNLYRIIQEAINNTVKYANATRMDIQLGVTGNKITLTIEDNGKGFDLAILQQANGIGIKNITSRVNVLKGEIDIDSQPGNGTLLAITLPLES